MSVDKTPKSYSASISSGVETLGWWIPSSASHLIDKVLAAERLQYKKDFTV